MGLVAGFFSGFDKKSPVVMDRAFALSKGDVFGSGLGGGVCCGDLIPVNDVPEGINVIRASVLIIQVIGVFPNIEAEDGRVAAVPESGAHEGAVLVGGTGHFEGSIGGSDQPCPTRAEAGRTGVGEGRLKGSKITESGIDGLCELAGWFSAAIGGKNAPKKAVIGMSTAIIPDSTLNGFREAGDVADEVVDRLRRFDAGGGECLVQLGDVGIVVFCMMDFHGPRIDVRFQGIIGVIEIW